MVISFSYGALDQHLCIGEGHYDLTMVPFSHRYLKGYINDNQDKNLRSYPENLLSVWLFLTKDDFSEEEKKSNIRLTDSSTKKR